MDTARFIAALVVGLFGIVFQVAAVWIVVATMISHTDVNNWMLALAAWGTAMFTGLTVGMPSVREATNLMA